MHRDTPEEIAQMVQNTDRDVARRREDLLHLRLEAVLDRLDRLDRDLDRDLCRHPAHEVVDASVSFATRAARLCRLCGRMI